MKIHPLKTIPLLLLIATISAQCAGSEQSPAAASPEVTSPAVQNTIAVEPTSSMPDATEAVTTSSAPPADPTEAAEPQSISLDGKTLAIERCSTCHSFSRVESARKTSGEWTQTVQRMISKGAVLTADEEQAVILYLSSVFPK